MYDQEIRITIDSVCGLEGESGILRVCALNPLARY